MTQKEQLLESVMNKLIESKKFTMNDVADRFKDINSLRISNYRVGKTGIRFEVTYSVVDGDKDFWVDCFVDLKNNGEISSTLRCIGTQYSSEDLDINSFVNNAIEAAVAQGYIELQDGVYVDKYNKNKDAAKSEFLNMINMSNDDIKNTLPGKAVEGLNNKATWRVLGVFTSYDNKEYVAMKKRGSFADPNIVELDRFKKSYRVID